MKNKIPNNSIDLIIADPPYGIKGASLDTHYNRNEKKVLPGYREVLLKDYQSFSESWIGQCARVLRPGGTIFIISGFTNLHLVLNALHSSELKEVNHLVAKFKFGVFTKKKFVSSHYHVLFWCKPPERKRIFNTQCRYKGEWDYYRDLQDIENIDIRKHNPGKLKNKNQLNQEFIEKLILYTSNKGDILLDPFMGGLTTAKAALELGRCVLGFEINSNCKKLEKDLGKTKKRRTQPAKEPDPILLKKRIKMREQYKKTRNKYKSKSTSLK